MVFWDVGGTQSSVVCSHAPTWSSHRSSKNGNAVFDVGETNLRISWKHCADLVILREPEGRVEVLRRKQGAYSGIKVVCFLICIGRDAPFEAKPPQAGSTESLMFLAESKELFYHKDVSLPL